MLGDEREDGGAAGSQEERLQMRGFVSEPGRASGIGGRLQRMQVEAAYPGGS